MNNQKTGYNISGYKSKSFSLFQWLRIVYIIMYCCWEACLTRVCLTSHACCVKLGSCTLNDDEFCIQSEIVQTELELNSSYLELMDHK